MSVKTKTKRYIWSIPIENPNQARALGNDLAWTIIDLLSEQGSDGYTIEQMREIFEKRGKSVSPSTLHNILTKLSDNEFVNRVDIRPQKRWGHPSKEDQVYTKSRKPAKSYYPKMFHYASIDDDFYSSFRDLLNTKFALEYNDFKKNFLELVDCIVEEYKTNPSLDQHFPERAICSECGEDHRGKEFLLAICYELIYLLDDSAEWQEFLKKLHYVERNE